MEPSDLTRDGAAGRGDAAVTGSGPQPRCPHCGARREPDVSWCGQCYADLRAAAATPGPRAAATGPAGPGAAPAAPVTENGAAAGAPTRTADAAELERIAAELLGQLAARPTRPGPAGVVERGFAGRGAKSAVMVGGAVAVTGLVTALLQLLGSLL